MNDKIENPAAFPLLSPDNPLEGSNIGMSLRDYFAAAALTGLITKSPYIPVHRIDGELDSEENGAKEELINALTVGAYNYADAMLKERAK